MICVPRIVESWKRRFVSTWSRAIAGMRSRLGGLLLRLRRMEGCAIGVEIAGIRGVSWVEAMCGLDG